MERKISGFLTSRSKLLLSGGVIGSIAIGLFMDNRELFSLKEEANASGTCTVSPGGHISGPSRDSTLIDLCDSSSHVSGIVNGHLSQVPDCSASQPFGGKFRTYSHCSSANGVELPNN